jgi:hypothetical protein
MATAHPIDLAAAAAPVECIAEIATYELADGTTAEALWRRRRASQSIILWR